MPGVGLHHQPPPGVVESLGERNSSKFGLVLLGVMPTARGIAGSPLVRAVAAGACLGLGARQGVVY